MIHARDFQRRRRHAASCGCIVLVAGLSCLPGVLSRALLTAPPQAVASNPPTTEKSLPEAPTPSAGTVDTSTAWDTPSRVPDQEPEVPISAKVLRYAQRLVEQYDTNHDGQLDKEEWQKMRGNPATVVRDHDDRITVQDLARYITIYGRYRRIQLMAPALVTNPSQPWGDGGPSPGAENSRRDNPAGPDASSDSHPWGTGQSPSAAATGVPGTSSASPAVETPPAVSPVPAAKAASSSAQAAGQRFFVPPARYPQGVPPWFIARDLDGDGQLTLSEFAPHATQADIEEFSRYDTNHDGVITVEEVLQFGKPAAEARGKAEEGKSKQ